MNPGTLTNGRVGLLSLNASAFGRIDILVRSSYWMFPAKVICNRHRSWTNLTSFPERYPLHGMIQQKASSIHYQGEISCMPCQPIFASCDGTSTCGQLPYLLSSCIRQKVWDLTWYIWFSYVVSKSPCLLHSMQSNYGKNKWRNSKNCVKYTYKCSFTWPQITTENLRENKYAYSASIGY